MWELEDNQKRKMEYVSIDQFNQGWNFFIKKINVSGFPKWGEFPCSSFLCPGCDDWLDANNQNRNVDKLYSQFLTRVFDYEK